MVRKQTQLSYTENYKQNSHKIVFRCHLLQSHFWQQGICNYAALTLQQQIS